MALRDPSLPTISCLMVTANRPHLMARSVACYMNQTYPNRQLVVVDDGEVDCSQVLSVVPADELVYVRLSPKNRMRLGSLRNRSIAESTGEILAQWDDDDWYHEDRLRLQYDDLERTGCDVSILSSTLVSVDDPLLKGRPFIGGIAGGVPGSIVHRRNDTIRYPDLRRAEDSEYLRSWSPEAVSVLPDDFAYLMIRVYHGHNTWSVEHFRRRIRNSPVRLMQYVYWKHIRRDLFGLPCFTLSRDMQRAYETYAGATVALGR